MEDDNKTRLIYKKRSIKLEEKRVKLRDGTWLDDFPIVTHENGVIVVPVVTKKDGVYIMLIEQWRIAMGITVIEVPGGGPMEGESAEQTAIREVKEEAGLDVKKLIKIGSVLPAPGWEIETQSHFIAECEPQVSDQKLDNTEHIERKLVSAQKVKEMLKNREIKDLKTKAILYDTLNYLGI